MAQIGTMIRIRKHSAVGGGASIPYRSASPVGEQVF
jgi:hypothetical protein